MSLWLDWSSPYFSKLNLSDTDAPNINQLVKAYQEYIEEFCNRHFAYAQYDEQTMILQDGSMILRNAPVNYIQRVCVARGNALTLTNGTAIQPTFSVTDTSLILSAYVSGVASTHELTWIAYPTLTQLNTAINGIGSGWASTMQSAYAQYPSSDIVAQQYGSPLVPLINWMDDTRQFRFDKLTGIIPGYSGNYETGYQAVNWNSVNPNLFTTAIRGDKVRVIYQGGYKCGIPEPVKAVLSHLVISSFQSPEGRMQMETIGNQYSYSLMSMDDMPASDKKILALYRNRSV